MKFNREREIKNNSFFSRISFKEFGGDPVYSAEDEQRLVEDFGYPEVEIGFIKGTFDVEIQDGKKHVKVTPADETVDRFHFDRPVLVTDEEEVATVVTLQDTGFNEDQTMFNVGFKLNLAQACYEHLRNIEIRLYNDGRINAVSNGNIKALEAVDEEYGGKDGQLSCPFVYSKAQVDGDCWATSSYDLRAPEKVQVRITVDHLGVLKEFVTERVLVRRRDEEKEIIVCSHFRGCKKVDENFSVTCRLPIKSDTGELCDPSVLSSERLSEYEAKCRLFEETIIKRIHLALQGLYAKDTIFEIEEGEEIVVSVNAVSKPVLPEQSNSHDVEDVFIG